MPVYPGVDYVDVDVRDSARMVARLGRAEVGIYAIDAPGQPLGCCVHPLIGLDVGDPATGAHLVESSIGDAGGVRFQSMLVGVEHLGAVALGVLASYLGRISDLILEHDYILARDGAVRGSSLGSRHGALLGQHPPAAPGEHSSRYQ